MIFLFNNKKNKLKDVWRNNFSKRLFLFLLISLFFYACKIVQPKPFEKNKDSSLHLSDSLTIIIASTNLSEDMSSLSSNDDEIALFVYSYTDSIIDQPPFIAYNGILSKTKMIDTTYFHPIKKITHKNLIVFIIEIDTDKKIEFIEPQIRKNHQALLKAYATKDYSMIERYLKDDDILGIKEIENFERGMSIEISDIHRMDRYHYQITFQ